jgi:hypothetical protein
MKIGVSFYYPVVKVLSVIFRLQAVMLDDALTAVKANFRAHQRVSVTHFVSIAN